MTEHRCENCRFWEAFEPEENGAQRGACHRWAPSLLFGLLLQPRDEFDDLPLEGIFPETGINNWCGEWQPQPLQQVDLTK